MYIGGKSEVALKEAVVDRYPRDSFQCATKLPLWDQKTHEELQEILDTSLQRAGLEYYDFYLLHAMSAERAQKADELRAWDFMKQVKAQGKAKHIGFSFHDSAEALEDILKNHPEMEFVQLQINYATGRATPSSPASATRWPASTTSPSSSWSPSRAAPWPP